MQGKFHRWRPYIVPALAGGAILAAAVAMVVASLRRPSPPVFAPSPPLLLEGVSEPGEPVTYTVDASDESRWVHFDFSRGGVVRDPAPLGWDLAFRRFRIVVNGGEGFPGVGGAREVSSGDVDAPGGFPLEGYRGSVAVPDTAHPVLGEWYRYDFFSHLLSPEPVVYAIRTADGGHAKLRFLSYYCPGPTPGCVTFRYVYHPP